MLVSSVSQMGDGPGSCGIGTVVSLMLPYVIILSVGWIAFFVAWYLLGIPWGPGSPVHP